MKSAQSPQRSEITQMQAVLQPANTTPRMENAGPKAVSMPAQPASPSSGYGLPCAVCHTYYTADLKACPVCKSAERVSPTALITPNAAVPAQSLPDPVVLDEERLRFLQELKAQPYGSALQINSAENSLCKLEHNHQGEGEPAVVCQGCYDDLQERVDLMEAALHMDVKEAAQLVYDAVWADLSDADKTYLNAAQALLTELRKRAGMSPVIGPFQPLSR